MSIFSDPRNDPDVTTLPCAIGTGDCEDLADGYCEECGKATCRSCAVEIDGGQLRCAYCQGAREKVAKDWSDYSRTIWLTPE